jgi:hypothetical protein
MSKKQNVPENIEKQFNKALFKIGEPVFFTWLGTKKYGYVTAIKQTNWGIQYTVEANNTRYPCGVQIKGYRTTYTTGCIFVDETRSFDADELKRRCQSGHKSTYSEVIRESERPKDESRIDDTNKRKISRTNNNKTKKTINQAENRYLLNKNFKYVNYHLTIAPFNLFINVVVVPISIYYLYTFLKPALFKREKKFLFLCFCCYFFPSYLFSHKINNINNEPCQECCIPRSNKMYPQ